MSGLTITAETTVVIGSVTLTLEPTTITGTAIQTSFPTTASASGVTTPTLLGPSPTSDPSNSSSKAFDWNWTKFGIIAGSVLGLIIILAFIAYAFKYKDSVKKSDKLELDSADPAKKSSNGTGDRPQFAFFSFSRRATDQTIARHREEMEEQYRASMEVEGQYRNMYSTPVIVDPLTASHSAAASISYPPSSSGNVRYSYDLPPHGEVHYGQPALRYSVDPAASVGSAAISPPFYTIPFSGNYSIADDASRYSYPVPSPSPIPSQTPIQLQPQQHFQYIDAYTGAPIAYNPMTEAYVAQQVQYRDVELTSTQYQEQMNEYAGVVNQSMEVETEDLQGLEPVGLEILDNNPHIVSREIDGQDDAPELDLEMGIGNGHGDDREAENEDHLPPPLPPK